MSYKPPAIGSLPRGIDPGLARYLTQIREALEVRANQRGNPLDAAPTFRDLVDAGIFKIKDGVSIGGRAYTADQIIGLVDFTLPAWITSDTAPPAPTGLQVMATRVATKLLWDASTFDQYGSTEIWRATGNNLSTATKFITVTGSEYTTAPPDPDEVFYYWIRHVSRAGTPGAFNDVNGAGTAEAPAALSVSHDFEGADLILLWPTPTSNFAISEYEFQYLDGSWAPLDSTASNSIKIRPFWAGSKTLRGRAKDINGNHGPWAEFAVVVAVPAAPLVSLRYEGENAVLTWAPPASSLSIDRYEFYDTEISPTKLLGTIYGTVFKIKVEWASKNLLVRAVDSVSNPGAAGSILVQPTPGVINTMAADVVDNNVLLRWTSTQGSLPTKTFELRRGATWATATVIGRKDGGFTVIPETPNGPTTYTYWLATVDSAENYGTPRSLTTTVDQPPDYLLAVEWISDFSGTKSNALVEGEKLVMPVNLTETVAQHFDTRSWASPQDQIDAGYPIYIQPGALTSYYEEVRDYGTTLAAMKITVSHQLLVLAGTLSTHTTITVALDSGFTSGVQVFDGVQQAFALNFRYVKIRVEVTAPDGFGVGEMSELRTKLDAKLRREAGIATMTLGGALAQGSFCNPSATAWTPGSLPDTTAVDFPDYSRSGGTAHQSIVLEAGPSGEVEPTWLYTPTTGSENTDFGPRGLCDGLPAFPDGVLIAGIFKKAGSVGTLSIRASGAGILTLAGASADNLVGSSSMPSTTDWYLVCAYVHPDGYAGADLGISGVYDMAGVKQADYAEYKMPSGGVLTGSSYIGWRWRHSSDGSGVEEQRLVRPVIIPCAAAAAPELIEHLIRCASDYGASVNPTTNFVDVSNITPGVIGLGASRDIAIVDFFDAPNKKRFNLFRYDPSGNLVGGDVSWSIQGY